MECKRILYFLDFPFNIGGSSKVLLTQASIMKQKGFQVKVVIPNDDNGHYAPAYDQLCNQKGLLSTTSHYHIYTTVEDINIMTVLKEYDEIKGIIEAYRPDLIHSCQINIAVELAAREFRIPHLMNVYQIDIDTFHIKWMDLYPSYHCADSLLYSKCWAEGLGISSRCIRVAYDRQRKQAFIGNKGKGLINIISIGVICERKNQMEIIKFVLECKRRGHTVRLIVVGDYSRPYAVKCKEFVAENGLQNEVFFTGYVTNVDDYLENADVSIIASTVESYPGVIVESMANRVPVISTAVGGVTEILRDGENAFLTKGHNSEDIYDAFLKYLDFKDSGKISVIEENAYHTYLKCHTYTQIGEQLGNYYQWIMYDYNHRQFYHLTGEEVREQFSNFICQYNLDKNDVLLMKRVWILYHIEQLYMKSKNKKIAIWGAGNWGRIILNWIRYLGMHKECIGFIDEKKQGIYHGYPIMRKTDDVIRECGMVLVAVADSQDQLQIAYDLERQGKVRNKDYFTICSVPVR